MFLYYNSYRIKLQTATVTTWEGLVWCGSGKVGHHYWTMAALLCFIEFYVLLCQAHRAGAFLDWLIAWCCHWMALRAVPPPSSLKFVHPRWLGWPATCLLLIVQSLVTMTAEFKQAWWATSLFFFFFSCCPIIIRISVAFKKNKRNKKQMILSFIMIVSVRKYIVRKNLRSWQTNHVNTVCQKYYLFLISKGQI